MSPVLQTERCADRGRSGSARREQSRGVFFAAWYLSCRHEEDGPVSAGLAAVFELIATAPYSAPYYDRVTAEGVLGAVLEMFIVCGTSFVAPWLQI